MKTITKTEVSRTSRNFVEKTPYGDYAVKETVVISKQTFPNDAGIYANKSYEIGMIFHNGNLVRDWSKPWSEKEVMA